MNIRYFFIVTFLLCSGFSSHAQYQMGGDPLRVSPSFAGSKSVSRITGNFLQTLKRSYLPNEPHSSSRNLTFSYDNYIKAWKCGVGIYYRNGRLNKPFYREDFQLNQSTIGVCIAPKLSNAAHFPSVTLSPSFGVEWIRYTLHYSLYPFPTVIKKDNLFSVRAGLLLNTSNSFLGASLKFLSSNNHNLLFTSIHAGHVFQRSASSKFSFSPTINVQYIEAFGAYNAESPKENYLYIDALNLNFRYKKLLFGTGIPNIMLGMQTEKVKAFVSYNAVFVNVNNYYDGQTYSRSLQFSMVYTFTKKQ